MIKTLKCRTLISGTIRIAEYHFIEQISFLVYVRTMVIIGILEVPIIIEQGYFVLVYDN